MLVINKNICLAILAFALLFSSDAAASRSTSSIVIDAKTGEVLFSERPNTIRHPASLTKLMTLYITFEALEKGILKMDDELPVSHTAEGRSPSKLGVKAGETIKVSTAIDALIIKSANDCATVLAEGLGYTETNFAEKMTEVARALGMKDTVFKNASGLPNSEQVTTARDMAALAAAVYYHFPQYYDLFSREEFTYKGKTYRTHNYILKSFEGADGMKTGYIASAGFNIVTSAQRNGERVIAVTMGHSSREERDKNVTRLMEQGFGKLALGNASDATATYIKLDSRDFSIDLLNTKEKENTPAQKLAPNAVWSVQLGAFSNYAKARVYAQKIRRRYEQLSKHQVNIEPTEKNSAVLYRSKLIGLTKNGAQKICKDLQKENKSCIVLPMNKNLKLTMADK